MTTVHLPAPLREMAGGEAVVSASGSTLGELIESLDSQYPGLKARLVEGERLRSGLAVFVNGIQIPSRLNARIAADADIYFSPAIAGG
jgi:molybdopterin converting factor small subunit